MHHLNLTIYILASSNTQPQGSPNIAFISKKILCYTLNICYSFYSPIWSNFSPGCNGHGRNATEHGTDATQLPSGLGRHVHQSFIALPAGLSKHTWIWASCTPLAGCGAQCQVAWNSREFEANPLMCSVDDNDTFALTCALGSRCRGMLFSSLEATERFSHACYCNGGEAISIVWLPFHFLCSFFVDDIQHVWAIKDA